MPLEIKELIVTATVPDASGNKGGNKSAAVDQEAIIAACVEQVLDILKEKMQP